MASPSIRLWSLALLVLILLAGSYLRFTGLNWDEGQWIHPDEGHMRIVFGVISWPDDLSLYFDTHSSPLNVRNFGERYSYGTFPLFLTRAAAEWLDRACTDAPAPLSRTVASLLVGSSAETCTPGVFTGGYGAVVGRALSALADLGTLVLIYLIGRRLYGEATGLLAAGLGAVTAFLIQQAHFFTVDSMACFVTMLVAYFSVRASQTGAWSDFSLAGIGVGLAAASKVSAVTAALLVALAGVSRLLESRGADADRGSGLRVNRSQLSSVVVGVCLAAVLSLVAFRIGQPYAFEGPGFFGVRPSPEWFNRLGQIRAEQAGEIDLPSGRQWANRMPIVFPWLNMVVWGMGLPLGLAAWIGWGGAGFELLRGKQRGRRHLVLWGWATAVFLYHSTEWVKAMRYLLPLYPVFLLFAAYWLVRGLRAVSSWWRGISLAASAVVVIGAIFWGVAFFTIYLRPHARLAASRWIYEYVPPNVTVANEHWDWGLPLRVDGYDPFRGRYEGIEMQHYHEDTEEKRALLYDWLDDSDYIFLASNRLYASIPRLPARYPLTIEYYRALFAGELGFTLEADFTSYPALGPFLFPNQENPFDLMEPRYESQRAPMEVRLPPAEESFSVYDHPRVLIFRKTEDYSRQRVEDVLGQVDLERVHHGQTPQQATGPDGMLRFDEETWEAQRAGGTWSEMFNSDSLLNRYPGLAALAWWASVSVLGWLAFPLLFVALPKLRDRGYGFSRLLGLLLVAYLTWLGASLRLLPNSRATIVGMVALMGIVGGILAWLKWDELRQFVRRRWRALLLMEGVFALLFLFWIGVRMLHPDLWHPVVGGEKPMDFAYLNAVMRSTWFPPYNPWLSGTWINYYYFGFVIVGTLTQLIGTVPAIAYNLAVPLIAALTGVAAFSVTFNLSPRARRWALLAGAAAVAFVLLIGNLGVVHLVGTRLIALGDVSFPSAIPGFPEAVSLIRGLWGVLLRGESLPMRIESWYWHPTRIVPAEAGNPIAEFPAFTFLYGDLHAHMIAFPLTLFALGLAVYWARTAKPTWSSLVLGGLVIGALGPTNTWDYPTYLLLGLIALGLGAWRPELGAAESDGTDSELDDLSVGVADDSGMGTKSNSWAARVLPFAWRAAVVGGLSLLLYLPYSRSYATGYDSLQLWEGGTTPATIYLWIHAILLFPIVTHLILEILEQVKREQLPWLTIGLGILAVSAVGVALMDGSYQVSLIAVPTAFWAGVLFLSPHDSGGETIITQERVLWLLVGTAMVLSLAVELVVLEGDIGRMNTVFKFYLQVWILLSIAAAISLAWIWRRSRQWAIGLRRAWWAAMAILVVGGAVFLPFGIYARATDRMAPETGTTLDGMAFMRYAGIFDGPQQDARPIALSGDYHAIRWMQETVEGSPVILEGLGWREYLWANRVSVYTGMPAVVGWRYHQVQQRVGVGGEMVNWRREDVNTCYNTRDIAEAGRILERYDVRYIYVGEYERAYYDRRGLAKFDKMVELGMLRVVYDSRGVTIYERLR